MAKKIIVNEGDDLKIVKNVTRLVTKLKNGNEIAWLPEDETQLITKTIIKDGTYIAFKEAEKAYGYSQVTVSGVGSKVMGELGEKQITENGTYTAKDDKNGPFYGYSKIYVNVPNADDGDDSGGGSRPVGKDGDGDDAVIGTDDDGNIVTTKLPTRISINVYPNNLVYENGQTIDFTGLRVKAFLPDGTEWGVVPDGELIKPVTVADASSIQPSELEGGTFVDSAGTYLGRANEREFFKTYSGRALAFFQVQPGSGWKGPILASTNPNAVYETVTVNGSPITVIGPYSTMQYEGVTIYIQTGYYYQTMDYENPGLPTTAATDIPGFLNEYFSSHNYHPAQSDQQTIPLQWKRPGDKKVLETSFSIAVH